jgi:hypothetical protein
LPIDLKAPLKPCLTFLNTLLKNPIIVPFNFLNFYVV